MKNWYVVISRMVVFLFSQVCVGFEFILNAVLSFFMVNFWLSQASSNIGEEEAATDAPISLETIS
jgi:hypothetical protein